MPRGASFGNAFDAAYMADSLVKAAFLACGEVEDDWGEAIQSVLIVARDKLKEALAILGGDLPQPEETANGA